MVPIAGYKRLETTNAVSASGSWWRQGFGAEEVVAEERHATAKPAVGAARRRHATGAHRREAEMGSGVGSTIEDAGSSGNLGK
uniref:DUF834 domain-containing protein n=1 Tax=Oryza glumipatula TaxID=40148 RepID=A0A0D9Y5U3_9ORYZ